MQPTSIPTGTLTPAQIAQGRASVNSVTSPSSPQNSAIDWSQISGAKENTSQPQTIQSNLGNTFNQGASNIESDVGNVQSNAQKAGGSPLAYAAAGGAAAGHIAGDIAGTAGGILGSFIAPLLPQQIKDSMGDATTYVANKINQIPGMTPDIAKSLGDLFNTATLGLGGAAEEPAINAIKSGASAAGDTLGQAADSLHDTISNIDISGSKATAAATTAREAAAQAGIKSLQEMRGSVSDYKNDLGTAFKQGATDIETKNPNLKLSLTPDQESALAQLKDNKSFALPEYLKPTATPGNLSDIETAHQLSPTQAQNLITQLNRSTFAERGSGLAVDQSKIGLTNEIKSAASKTFGKGWDKTYGDYAKGSNAVDKISDIVNIDKNATASDINKNLNSILKLSKTPEGKIILQNSINEFKNVSGIDLSPGKDVIGQILDKQEALAKSSKPGIIKSATNPAYLSRRLIGGGLSIGLLYPAIRAIQKAAK